MYFTAKAFISGYLAPTLGTAMPNAGGDAAACFGIWYLLLQAPRENSITWHNAGSQGWHQHSVKQNCFNLPRAPKGVQALFLELRLLAFVRLAYKTRTRNGCTKVATHHHNAWHCRGH